MRNVINFTAIYVMWLREMKRFMRAKSRIVGTLAMPLFFLAFLGFGFRRMPVPGLPAGVDYLQFLVPGIVGMTMLFTSMFAGLSVIWDREYGFLKEIMVTPVSRVSIVLGRIAGGTTTAVFQGIMVLLISGLMGFPFPGVFMLFWAVVFMILIAFTFIGLGLIFASKMKDPHGFGLIMNFVVFPFFFLSGAFYPIDNMPKAVRILSYLDPLTYGVDGLRGVLLGAPAIGALTDLMVLAGSGALMVGLGAWFFEKSESV
jgi:ABC-2 type transport system permease protein